MIILGSTGSIGENALRLARRFGVRVSALACRASVARLNEQIAQFAPRFVCVRDEAAAREVVGVPRGRVFSGVDGVERMLEACREWLDGGGFARDFGAGFGAEFGAGGGGLAGGFSAGFVRRGFENKVINALVGFSGFMPSVRALELGFELCLANKESLVVGGKFLARLAAGASAEIGAGGAANSNLGDGTDDFGAGDAKNLAQNLAKSAAQFAQNIAHNGVNDARNLARDCADLAGGFSQNGVGFLQNGAQIADKIAKNSADLAQKFAKNGEEFARDLAKSAAQFSQNPAQNHAQTAAANPTRNPAANPAPALAASPRIRPIDSEHFGLAFLLKGRENQAQRLVITASGGAFFDLSREQMRTATAAAALRHPNWQMGSKITIDSATMANKLFECAEAFWLFGVGEIAAVVERTSTIHALVEFADGSTSAHFCQTDMALAIAHAIGLCDGGAGEIGGEIDGKNGGGFAPNLNLGGGGENLAQNFANPATNCPQILPNLDILKLAEIKFQPIDTAKFPIFSLKDELLARTDLGAVINAANEVAVGRFLRGECGFLEIERAVFAAVERFGDVKLNSPQDAAQIDAAVREFCQNAPAK